MRDDYEFGGLGSVWGTSNRRGGTPETRTDPRVWVRAATPHQPNYTREERPYGYSEFFLHGDRSDTEYDRNDSNVLGPISAEYSDRIWQWARERGQDPEKMWQRHNPGRRFNNTSFSGIQDFLREFHKSPLLELCAVAEGCNVSNGYPYWIVWFRPGYMSLDAVNKDRKSWRARRVVLKDGRVTGELTRDFDLVRKFNVKVTNGRFKVDIGTGSGVKITFALPGQSEAGSEA